MPFPTLWIFSCIILAVSTNTTQTPDVVSISGFSCCECCNGRYYRLGSTPNSAPYYRHDAGNLYLYYDVCGQYPLGWQFDHFATLDDFNNRPPHKACFARSPTPSWSESSSPPPGQRNWHVNCHHDAWEALWVYDRISIERAGANATTAVAEKEKTSETHHQHLTVPFCRQETPAEATSTTPSVLLIALTSSGVVGLAICVFCVYRAYVSFWKAAIETPHQKAKADAMQGTIVGWSPPEPQHESKDAKHTSALETNDVQFGVLPEGKV